MNQDKFGGFFSNLRNDLPASLVVFLVAVPLCLGIALASGAPLFSGIIAGIVGGIVVALISGSPLGVSGPAAGLAAIVLAAIEDLGAFETFLVAVVLAGLIQIILGIIKGGVIGYFFPSAVIKGMLAGIGIIIFLKQIPHAFGYDKDPEGDLGFFQIDGENTFTEMINAINFISPGALIISLVSLAVLILWEQPFMKKISVFRIIQGPLVVVAAGIGFNMAFQGGDFALTAEQTVSIPVPDSISGFFQQFTFPDFTQISNGQVWITALIIAVVASLETLLCVDATDKLDPQKRITPTNRELTAQGVGNMISGLIGGLPVTQVIVRSSANIQSGGKTKASAFFHGVLLLACAMTIPNVLNMVPLASLAAILLVVGYKLAKPSLMKAMWNAGLGQFIPFAVTILGIVFIDLLRGIGLGMAVAVVQILWNNYRIPYNIHVEHFSKDEPFRIHLAEEVSFLNKASIQRSLDQLPNDCIVIIDAQKTHTIHPDVIEIIMDFSESAPNRGIQVTLEGLEDLMLPNPVRDFGRVVLTHDNDKKDQ